MRRFVLIIVTAGLAAATLAALAAASHSTGTVSPSQETAWPWEPQGSIPAGTAGNDWEHGFGDLARTDFSYLKQINTSNVGKLKVAWQEPLAHSGYNGPIQGTPIVVSGARKNLPLASGTMFVAADAGVVALEPDEREDSVEVRRPAAQAQRAGARRRRS